MKRLLLIATVVCAACHSEVKTDATSSSVVTKTDDTVSDKTRDKETDRTRTEGPVKTITVEDAEIVLAPDGAAVMRAWLAAHRKTVGAGSGSSAARRPLAFRRSSASAANVVKLHVETTTERGPVVDETKQSDKSAAEVKAKTKEEEKKASVVQTDTVKDKALPGWKLYGTGIIIVILLLLAGLAVLRYKLWRP